MRLPADKRLFWLSSLLWVLLAFAILFKGGIRHDYRAYVKQWAYILNGGNPWAVVEDFDRNAYGPVHNVLALLFLLDDLAPKMFVGSLFACLAICLGHRIFTERKGAAFPLIIYAITVPFSGSVLLMGFGSGSNDLFVASLLLLAILFRVADKYMLAGCLVGLATLLKFYPLLFLPCFMVGDEKLRVRGLVSALITIVAGIALSYGVWGYGMLDAVSFGTERPSGLLSVINGLKRLDIEALNGVVAGLTKYNTYMVFIVAGLTGLFTWWRGNHWLSCLVISMIAVFLTYKTGHQQFFLPWLVAVGALLLINVEESDKVALRALPYVLFLSMYDYLFFFHRPVTRSEATFFAFASFCVGCVSLVAMLLVKPNAGRRRLSVSW